MTILLTGAGSSMGFDIAHCLRQCDEAPEIIGTDADPVGRMFAAQTCHEVLDVPRADDPAFVAAFDAICDAVNPEAVFICPEPEIAALNEHPTIRDRVPLPPAPAVERCLDKYRTYEQCRSAAPFPWTRRLYEMGNPPPIPPWWVRSATGAGARGAMTCHTSSQLHAWLALNPGVDDWIVQQYLPGDNLNVTLLYWHGQRSAASTARRNGYVLAKASLCGVTGDVSEIETVSRPDAVQIAHRAVEALPGEPHGFYSVDLRDWATGDPRVTEINPRLAGRPWLSCEAGVNFPILWLECLRGRPPAYRVETNPGVVLYRKVGREPIVGGANQ